MKIKDYFRLGKISIQSRKKSTKNTVRGIVFGLVLLIPVIFFGLAFYLDFNAQLNKVEPVSSFNLAVKNSSDKSGDLLDTESSAGMLSFNYYELLKQNKNVEEILVSEYYNLGLKGLTNEGIYINDILLKNITDTSIYDSSKAKNSNGDYYYSYGSNEFELSANIKIIENELNPNLFTQAELNYLESNDLGSAFKGDGFSTNSNGEIMVSERFLEYYGLTENVLGKTITIKLTNAYGSTKVDNNTNPNDTYDRELASFDSKKPIVVSKFKIVGIISEEVYKIISRENEADVWVTKDSLYTSDNVICMPTLTTTTDEEYGYDYLVATYENTFESLQTIAVTNKVVFLPFGYGAEYADNEYGFNPHVRSSILLIQATDFNGAVSLNEIISAYIEKIAVTENAWHDYDSYYNEIFQMTRTIYNAGFYVILIFALFGGIIFFVTLLNLYNSVNYSVESRKNYIGVMRAIGFKNRNVIKLYFVEIMSIFIRAIIWTTVISGILCYGIKFGVDKVFEIVADVMPISLSLNFMYFPVALVIIVAFDVFIAILYSVICCHKVSSKPILTVLKDER